MRCCRQGFVQGGGPATAARVVGSLYAARVARSGWRGEAAHETLKSRRVTMAGQANTTASAESADKAMQQVKGCTRKRSKMVAALFTGSLPVPSSRGQLRSRRTTKSNLFPALCYYLFLVRSQAFLRSSKGQHPAQATSPLNQARPCCWPMIQ